MGDNGWDQPVEAAMSADTLFDLPEEQDRGPSIPTSPEEARVLRPVRNQVEMIMRDLVQSGVPGPPSAIYLGLAGEARPVGVLRIDQGGADSARASTTDPRVLLVCVAVGHGGTT